MEKSKNILVTGAVGFIGFHICMKLLKSGERTIGLDNINNYYDINLKKNRLKLLNESVSKNNEWNFIKGDLEDLNLLEKIFNEYAPCTVIHLAAQAGVRYSIDNPRSYINTNLVGFANILECCRKFSINNLIYASSSSIYGGNTNLPFSENDPVNHPVSLYAATKRANELMAHTYSHLFNINTTGLRFFTVYGPWGRPDMAPMIFTKSILNNKTIKIFNHGNMFRDFTYIDDVVEIVSRLVKKPAIPSTDFDRKNPKPSVSWAPYKIFNIGNNKLISLIEFISILEKEIGIEAKKEFIEMQDGDVPSTLADNQLVADWTGYKPKTPLNKGIKKFVTWYLSFYKN